MYLYVAPLPHGRHQGRHVHARRQRRRHRHGLQGRHNHSSRSRRHAICLGHHICIQRRQAGHYLNVRRHAALVRTERQGRLHAGLEGRRLLGDIAQSQALIGQLELFVETCITQMLEQRLAMSRKGSRNLPMSTVKTIM